MSLFGSKWKSSKTQTLARWLKSAEQRTIELQSFPSYWKLRNRKGKIAFFLRKLLFKVKWSYEDKKEWNSSRFIIFKTFLKPFIFAIFIVFLLEISEYLFLQNKSVLRPYTPERLVEFWNWLRQKVNIDIATYRTLLSPLITVSGTFLGLYFTALNVLLSSTYKQVTADVRTLLIRDKVGNAYTQIVAFTGAYSLILFGLATTGYIPSLISLILLICLGITEIYCFINQWFRLFRLFDPSMLVYYLTKDLALLIKEATIKGHWSQDISFQAHFQNQAEDKLNTYRNLIFTAKSEEHLRSQSLIKLVNSLLSLLWIYESKKLNIPSESKWFKTTYQHKDWMTASHSETSMATQTGTTLFPKEVPDLMWVEKEIGKIIDFALKGFLEKEDLNNALSLFQNFQNLTKALAQNYSIEEALLLFRTIKVNTQNHSRNFEVPQITAENDLDSLKFTLALVDFYALSFINIFLGFVEVTERLNLESFKDFIEKTDWKNSKSIYRATFPRKVLQQLELAKKHLDFERAVEGKIVTPIWYQLQLLTLSYFRFLESTINSLLTELEEVFLKEADSLIKQKKFIIAIQVIERGFEACNKFEYHFYALETHCEELNKSKQLTDIPSIDFSWREYQKKIESIHEQLVVLFSKLLYPIMQLPKIEDLPDYFGHAYTVLTDECYLAMASGNEELFKKLFLKVFNACFEAHDRQIKLEITDEESKFIMVADPIVDLLDLSGYAIIFQELDEKKFWDIVQSTWDKYFADEKDKLPLIKTIITLGTHRSFLMSPRSTTRTSWQQHLERILRRRGLMRDSFTYEIYSEEETLEKHPSKIIRNMFGSSMLYEKAREIFVATYFKNEIKKGEIKVSDKVLHFYRKTYEKESE